MVITPDNETFYDSLWERMNSLKSLKFISITNNKIKLTKRGKEFLNHEDKEYYLGKILLEDKYKRTTKPEIFIQCFNNFVNLSEKEREAVKKKLMAGRTVDYEDISEYDLKCWGKYYKNVSDSLPPEFSDHTSICDKALRSISVGVKNPMDIEILALRQIVKELNETNMRINEHSNTIKPNQNTQPLNHELTLENLKSGDELTNEGLCEIFKCGPQGGMRKSNRTNSLILISDHTKMLYDDRWLGDVLHYTGMGLKGDQSISFAQNKTLAESETNRVDIHLFEVFRPKQYTYSGRIELEEAPYWDTQEDIDGNLRKVIIFPIKLKDDGLKTPISESILLELQEEKEKIARRLSKEELEARANMIQGPPSQRSVSTTMYNRNPNVSTFAKARAEGICQLCQQPAPFLDKNNEPYLETHHIVWLSEGGDDSIQNTVALCPNCHRKMHLLNLEDDKTKLFDAIGERR